jgi:hypothetical protein
MFFDAVKSLLWNGWGKDTRRDGLMRA